MSQLAVQLNEVWDALRASKGQRDEALVEVRIRNLRGIWDLRFPFDYPVSVLAGPNGSGKSTVLFACACAYRVPGRGAGDFAPGRLFPNFISHQPAVQSDLVPETLLEFHYVHRGARRSMTWRRGKSWNRKGGGQPERQVYLRTLANLTSPGEVRSILQLGRKQVRTETISPDLLIFAHRILPWRYHNLNLISGQSSRDLLFAEIEGTGETRYSEFHMSSGERTIVRISKDISGLENALVLIDEVDTGLHPYTQQQAMLELQRSALRRNLQIIVASHSPVVLDSVPPEARIFLDRDHVTGQVRREPLYRDIFQKALYGQSQDRLSILCEDEVAEGVIRGVLDVLNVELGLLSRHTCYVAFVLITFSSSHDGEEVGMKRYVVALEKEERDELAGITRKGSHQSQKVINALILLNCDEGEFNEHRARGEAVAEILRISARKVDRVKKRFVEEGMEAALGGRQGRRPSYVRKADGEFEARLVALSCAEPPEGHSQWSLRLLADRVVELGHIDSVSHETVRRVLKKTQSSRGGASAG